MLCLPLPFGKTLIFIKYKTHTKSSNSVLAFFMYAYLPKKHTHLSIIYIRFICDCKNGSYFFIMAGLAIVGRICLPICRSSGSFKILFLMSVHSNNLFSIPLLILYNIVKN